MSDKFRQQWMMEFASVLREGLASVNGASPDCAADRLRAVTTRLPPASTAEEEDFARAAVLRFACNAALLTHGDARGECLVFEAMQLRDLCSSPAITGLIRWTNEFATHLLTQHRSLAARVAAEIKSHCDRPLSLARLARVYGTTPQTLRREFRRKFGMSVRDYVERQRIARAIDSLPTSKVESVALDVGYQSAKNFYRALFRHTQLTPGQCRRLSPVERETVKRSLGIEGAVEAFTFNNF